MKKFKNNFKNIIFILYTFIIFFLYFSGMIKKMIHPRMYLFIILSGIILLLFFFTEKIFFDNNKNKKVKITNILYLVPIFLFIFVNSADISNQLIKNKGIDIGVNAKEVSEDNSEDNLNNEEDNKDNEDEIEEDYSNLEIIELTDKDFLFKGSDISYNIDSYIGKGLKYTGFIYRDETINDNQFVVGRLAMTCCSADASLSGFLATYKNYNELKDNEWYEITAVIDKTKYSGFEVAYLKIFEIKKVDKPSDEYIY